MSEGQREQVYQRKEKPEPPEGHEWVEAIKYRTTTRENFETRPLDECPNCGEWKHRLVWQYRGGFTYWWQVAYWCCENCEYEETITEQSAPIGIGKWINRLEGVVKRA